MGKHSAVKSANPIEEKPFTLEQLCRALAAHGLLCAHPNLLHEFLAPETAERTAQFIHRFALGEPVERPKPSGVDFR